MTRGKWLWLDNGVQVSLGNRRDLTQDDQLPFGFFLHLLPCAFFAFPPSCPLTVPSGRRKIYLKSLWRKRDEEITLSYLSW